MNVPQRPPITLEYSHPDPAELRWRQVTAVTSRELICVLGGFLLVLIYMVGVLCLCAALRS